MVRNQCEYHITEKPISIISDHVTFIIGQLLYFIIIICYVSITTDFYSFRGSFHNAYLYALYINDFRASWIHTFLYRARYKVLLICIHQFSLFMVPYL